MKIIVVGGGASGMFVSGLLAEKGHTVDLFERNDKLGKKLYITGKGRCNLTNNSDKKEILNNVVTNAKFLTSAIYSFDSADTVEYFENLGVKTKVERGNRVFPLSDKSSDVIRALTKKMEDYNVNIHFNSLVGSLIVDNNEVKGISCNNENYFADAVVLACGGCTYTSTGSDGKGYTLLAKVGHTIVLPRPALVPLLSDDPTVEKMSGLTLKNVSVSACFGHHEYAKEFGELLFTHKGFSGPTVLTISSYINSTADNSLRLPKGMKLCIDLKPALDEKTLDKRILRDFSENINKELVNVLPLLTPRSLIPKICLQSGIPSDKKVNTISKEERKKLVDTLKCLTFKITALDSLNSGIITQGGVNVNEVNPKDMQSKIISNLYICGEMLDVDALTGGFNLQIAFSTAYAVANHID